MHRARGDLPWPAHDPGLAHAALVEPALARSEGQVAGRVALAGGEPAVVGGEHDEGVLREAEPVEGAEHLADRLVHGRDHRGVHGVLLDEAHLARALLPPLRREAQLLALALVALHEIRPAHERRVHRVEAQGAEPALVRVLLDEAHGLLGETRRQVVALLRLEARHVEGVEVLAAAVGATAAVARHVDLEALGLGLEALAAEVPLAREEGPVAGGQEELRVGLLLVHETVHVGRGDQRQLHEAPVALPLPARRREDRPGLRRAEVVGRVEPRRVAPGHQARARRAAHRARRVAAREARALGAEPVEVRRVVEGRGVLEAHVHEAEIVGDDDQDVGAGSRLDVLRCRCPGAGGQEEERRGGGERLRVLHGPLPSSWGRSPG